MAVHFDSITANPVGSVTVTGIPFAPSAVMFWGVHTASVTISQSFGVGSADLSQWSMWGGIRQQTSVYAQRHREMRNDSCINIYDTVNHSILRTRGTLTAFTSDGFTVSFIGSGPIQPVFYMAIGGRNISDAQAGIFDVPPSAGPVSVTGTGFKPKALLLAHQLDGTVNTQNLLFSWGVGFTDGTNQHSNWGLAAVGVATGGNHMQRTDGVACGNFAGFGTYVLGFDSFDADGFTVDVTDPWIGSVPTGYLAIDCARAVVGTSDFPDSTGVVSYPTPGMEPGGVFFSWNGADTVSTAGSAVMPVRPGVGGMDGPEGPVPKMGAGTISGLHRASAPFGAYQPLQTWANPEALELRGEGSQVDPGSTTTLAAGRFAQFDEELFEVNWTTAVSNTRQFGWLALPGEVIAPWLPHIYRRVYG